MSILHQPAMIGSEFLYLVDIDGFDVPECERDQAPHDAWDSPYWDFVRIELGRSVLDDDQAEDFEFDPPDAPDDPRYVRSRLAELDLAPISGGAPNEPFEPSEADWASYREWAEAVDRQAASYDLLYGYE